MVAREVGEGRRCEAHAVEAPLIDSERGGFHRKMRDAASREFIEQLVQFDRPRASSANHNARPLESTMPTVPSEAASWPSGRPDLAQKGDDRGLAARAGDCDDGVGLARIEARRRMSERGAHVVDDNRAARRQSARRSAQSSTTAPFRALRRLSKKESPSPAWPGMAREAKPRRDGAAVRGQARDLESRRAPGSRSVLGERSAAKTHQWPWPPVAGTLAIP